MTWIFSNNCCPFLSGTLKTNKSMVVFAVQWLFCGIHSHAHLSYVWMPCFGWKSEINFAACVKWADHSRCKHFTQTNKSLWTISWWTDLNLVSAAFQLCLGVFLKLQIVYVSGSEFVIWQYMLYCILDGSILSSPFLINWFANHYNQ